MLLLFRKNMRVLLCNMCSLFRLLKCMVLECLIAAIVCNVPCFERIGMSCKLYHSQNLNEVWQESCFLWMLSYFTWAASHLKSPRSHLLDMRTLQTLQKRLHVSKQLSFFNLILSKCMACDTHVTLQASHVGKQSSFSNLHVDHMHVHHFKLTHFMCAS